MNIEIKNGIAIIQSDEIVITDTGSALDLMMTVRYETNCDSMVIAKSAVTEDFFVLSTGIAGEIMQKFVNYRMKLAIIGDYSGYTSKPLRDFIFESNKGRHIFFAATEEEAVAKLSCSNGERPSAAPHCYNLILHFVNGYIDSFRST